MRRPPLRLFALLSLGSALALAACDPPPENSDAPPRKSSSYEPAAPKPAPTSTWEEKGLGHKAKLKGANGKVLGHFEVNLNGSFGTARVKIYASDLVDGVEIRGGGKTTSNDESPFAQLEYDTDFALGSVTLKDVMARTQIDTGLTFEVAVKGYEPAVLTVPPISVRYAVSGSFKDVDKGAVEFKGEPDGAGQRDTLLDLGRVSMIEEIYGNDKKVVQDIDLVAMEEQVETDQTKRCSGYTNGAIEFTLYDSHMRVYDRRTGNLVSETTIKPRKKCPSFAVTSNGKAALTVNDKEKKKWFRKLLKKS
ncbi:MAG: hypothetical protein AAF799_31890 [Myxococcota bacterium]